MSLLRMRYKHPGQFERIPSTDQGDPGSRVLPRRALAFAAWPGSGGDRYAE
jgi:hypothetical protein